MHEMVKENSEMGIKYRGKTLPEAADPPIPNSILTFDHITLPSLLLVKMVVWYDWSLFSRHVMAMLSGKPTWMRSHQNALKKTEHLQLHDNRMEHQNSY